MAYRDCPHTPGVTCDSKGSCERCGWEPKEQKRRKAAIDAGKMHKNLFGVSRLKIKKKSRPGSSSSEGGKANNPNTI